MPFPGGEGGIPKRTFDVKKESHPTRSASPAGPSNLFTHSAGYPVRHGSTTFPNPSTSTSAVSAQNPCSYFNYGVGTTSERETVGVGTSAELIRYDHTRTASTSSNHLAKETSSGRDTSGISIAVGNNKVPLEPFRTTPSPGDSVQLTPPIRAERRVNVESGLQGRKSKSVEEPAAATGSGPAHSRIQITSTSRKNGTPSSLLRRFIAPRRGTQISFTKSKKEANLAAGRNRTKEEARKIHATDPPLTEGTHPKGNLQEVPRETLGMAKQPIPITLRKETPEFEGRLREGNETRKSGPSGKEPQEHVHEMAAKKKYLEWR